jgi:predicted transcriptional regulator
MRPQARIVKTLNQHRLSAVQYDGVWTFHSDFPEIAAQFDGARDAVAAIEEFERLATAGAEHKGIA